ncbi:gamma-glutamylcyclotransferase family protein [Acinetobacter sp. MD2]|uniref:gamma-glutamylcyclotransferase family protein n=1 Tax=Acinetobacter sp. MD2 TaxID=2600066 RepID=UPI002D1F0859|nr:gamma-glutamylcyclotransferase family protein [Acinetobacter sp. MD2]MEB3767976.1 gamma-glutamylcyclotransferase [Acinetobacter sp. MD2]
MNRLFAYGTLRPHQPNAHVLEKVEGTWQTGYVNGVVHTLDWGPDVGLPALVLDSLSPKIEGMVLSSDALAENLEMLDEFEGFQYQRVKTVVELETGESIQAWVYVMNPNAKQSEG